MSQFLNEPTIRNVDSLNPNRETDRPENSNQLVEESSGKLGIITGSICRRLGLVGFKNQTDATESPWLHRGTWRLYQPSGIVWNIRTTWRPPARPSRMFHARTSVYKRTGWKIYAQIRGWCSLPPHGISPFQPRMALESREPVSLNNAKGSMYTPTSVYTYDLIVIQCSCQLVRFVDTTFLWCTND